MARARLAWHEPDAGFAIAAAAAIIPRRATLGPCGRLQVRADGVVATLRGALPIPAAVAGMAVWCFANPHTPSPRFTPLQRVACDLAAATGGQVRAARRWSAAARERWHRAATARCLRPGPCPRQYTLHSAGSPATAPLALPNSLVDTGSMVDCAGRTVAGRPLEGCIRGIATRAIV